MDIRRQYPFEDFDKIREHMNSSFMEPFPVGLHQARPLQVTSPERWPSVDVRESQDDIIISAEVPGIHKEDLDITVNEDHLIIKGTISHSTEINDEDYRLKERRDGSFKRVIPFSSRVIPDQTHAQYKDGLVEITIPKEETDPGSSHKVRFDNS